MKNIHTHYPFYYHETGEATWELYGDLTKKCAQNIEADFFAIKDTGVSRLIIDFSKVQYINSTGIAVLIKLIQLGRNHDVELQAVNLSEHYQELFEITKLSEYIHIID